MKSNVYFACMGFFFTGFFGAGFSASARPPFPTGVGGHEGDKVIPIEKEDRDYYLHKIQGVELRFPREIRLKGNEVDLSPVIRQLRRVEESHYDNFWNLERISRDLLEYYIDKLCAKTTTPERCLNKASDDLKTVVDGINQKMTERILYPSGYFPSSGRSVRDRTFQIASEALDSKCAGACGDHFLSKTLIQGSRSQYRELYGKLRGKSRQCQKDLLDDMVYSLESKRFPKPCLKEENKNHPVCKDMLKSMKMTQRRVSKLMDLAYGPESAGDTEAKAPCLTCALKVEEGSIPPLKKLAKSLEDKSQCLELNPGEEKTVHPGRGTGTSYTLKRNPDGSYSITFPIKFSVDENYDGPFSKEEAPDRYRERVQKCLAKASQNMLGPNGEKLKIQIAKPPWEKSGGDDSGKKSQCREEKKTGTQYINIGAKDHRSNAGKYESDIDCPTITHEILHLTGLCDEYKETSYGFYTDPKTGETAGNNFEGKKSEKLNPSNYKFKPAWDCRVTAKNSIMSNQYERWDNVKNGKNKSLLTTAQFKGILYGSCSGKNGKFNECSRLAYQSSQTAKKGDCQKAKSQCEKENGLGHDKQEQIAALQKDIKGLEQFKQGIVAIRKQKQDQGKLSETQRDEYNRELKKAEEKIKLEREFLSRAQSQNEKTKRRNILKNLSSWREVLLTLQKIDEEKGLLDQTVGEKYNGYLSDTEKSLQDSKEKLRIVHSWPDS